MTPEGIVMYLSFVLFVTVSIIVVSLAVSHEDELVHNEALTSSSCIAGVLYPDEYDCTKFYMCVPYGLQPFICPSGLLFNPISQNCDWPELAECMIVTTTTYGESYIIAQLLPNDGEQSGTETYIDQFSETTKKSSLEMLTTSAGPNQYVTSERYDNHKNLIDINKSSSISSSVNNGPLINMSKENDPKQALLTTSPLTNSNIESPLSVKTSSTPDYTNSTTRQNSQKIKSEFLMTTNSSAIASTENSLVNSESLVTNKSILSTSEMLSGNLIVTKTSPTLNNFSVTRNYATGQNLQKTEDESSMITNSSTIRVTDISIMYTEISEASPLALFKENNDTPSTIKTNTNAIENGNLITTEQTSMEMKMSPNITSTPEPINIADSSKLGITLEHSSSSLPTNKYPPITNSKLDIILEYIIANIIEKNNNKSNEDDDEDNDGDDNDDYSTEDDDNENDDEGDDDVDDDVDEDNDDTYEDEDNNNSVDYDDAGDSDENDVDDGAHYDEIDFKDGDDDDNNDSDEKERSKFNRNNKREISKNVKQNQTKNKWNESKHIRKEDTKSSEVTRKKKDQNKQNRNNVNKKLEERKKEDVRVFFKIIGKYKKTVKWF